MKKVKKKYGAIEAENFLLSEENAKLKAEMMELKADHRESLDFICKLTGPAEKLAVEFLTRKLGKVCGL